MIRFACNITIFVIFVVVSARDRSYDWSVFNSENMDFCQENLCNGKPHTMCLKDDKPPSSCTDYSRIKLSAVMKRNIVIGHNGLRNRIANSQKSASNMCYLHWDSDLEMMAEKWVAQCNVTYDPCEYIYNESYPIGQNIMFVPRVPLKNWEAHVVRDWFLEGFAYDSKDIERLPPDKANNYTQLIWAETKFIGCAAAKFKGGYFTVCNYFPKGNIIGDSIYKQGPSCQQCPESRSSCSTTFPGLCGLDDIYVASAVREMPDLLLQMILFLNFLNFR